MYSQRRRPRAAGRDRLVFLLSLLLLAATIWVVSHLASQSVRQNAANVSQVSAASAADTGRVGIPTSDLLDAARSLVSPPYSWDYRWADAHAAVGAPAVHGRSFLLVDVSSRQVLYSHDPHRRLPLASTTKLMTAMVALDHASPDATIIVPDSATNVEPDVMGLSAGEQLTVRELLYGLLLDSGNDAAETLAQSTVGGGRQAFLRAMNVKARALGLSDTHFVNPSGLDDPQQYSSAHDLALTAAYLYQHYSLLEQVVTTKQATLPYSTAHKAFFPTNFDKLLWTYPGAIGFKTGLTDNAGQVFVGGAHRGSHTLISVEMNDPLIFTDAAALMDYGFRRQGQ